MHRSVPFEWPRHRARLLRGAAVLSLDVDITALESGITTLLSLNDLSSGLLRIALSRAGGERGYKPRSRSADIIIETGEAPHLEWHPPLSVRISSYKRPSGSTLPAGIKFAQGVTSTLAGIEALDTGFADAILLTEQNLVSEATSSNIFWRAGEQIFTPSRECGIIAGVMREVVSTFCHPHVIEGTFTLPELLAADEVFLTNVITGIQPIHRITFDEHHYHFTSFTTARRCFDILYRQLSEE